MRTASWSRLLFVLAILSLALAPASAQNVSVSINEYPAAGLNAGAGPIVSAPDSGLWFPLNFVGTIRSFQIARSSTTGVVTTLTPAARFSAVWGMAVGGDGAIWYTYTNGISKVTTAGAFTDFSLPAGSPSATGIAAGPDGAMWFTAYNNGDNGVSSSLIGRITTAGTVSEFTLPGPASAPQSIARGPDGALWFTEFLGKIGRITVDGATILEYPVPGSPVLGGITAGPDGALWFTEPLAKKIGRITTAGVVTEYSVSVGSPNAIAAGPDNALWFTADANIGRITTSGTVTEYPVPSGLATGGITAGLDGNMWFTEANTFTAKIGQAVITTNSGIPPALSIQMTPGGPFTQGQNGAAYTLVVSNQGGSSATSGLVSVTDTLPSGLTLVSMLGVGWACNGNVCTRNDPLAGGSAYQPITVTVNVAANASSPQVNVALVTGGNSPNASTSYSTMIGVSVPLLSITKTHSGNFQRGQQNAQYVVTVSNGATAGSTNGTVTVTDTLPAGETLVSMAGVGWNCASNACTRSDTLAAGNAYPAITVTVNVATNAGSPQINIANVSGGGNLSSVGIADPTTITSSGFFSGEVPLSNGVYFLQLPNNNSFGYYSYLTNGVIYHFDLGYEYAFAGPGTDVYFFDYASGHWFYTGANFFPYLYDFTRADWLYYVPSSTPGRYTSNPRQFASTTTHVVFTQ